MITDPLLHGWVLHGRSGSYRVQGRDAEGRVWARPCTAAGKETSRELVELSPDRWAAIERRDAQDRADREALAAEVKARRGWA